MPFVNVRYVYLRFRIRVVHQQQLRLEAAWMNFRCTLARCDTPTMHPCIWRVEFQILGGT